jgi:integrase
MSARKPRGHVDRKPTRHRAIYYRGSSSDRRYYVTWRCHGTCANKAHRAKRQGQHWERSYGEDISDAIKLRDVREADVDRRRALAQRGEKARERRTFAQVEAEYKRSRAWTALAPATRTSYQSSLTAHVLPTFGETFVDEIDADAIAVWLEMLRSAPRTRRSKTRAYGLSESAVNGALTALRVVLRFAAERSRYLDRNPAADLSNHELPKPESDRRVPQVLTEDELDRLYDSAPSDLFRLMLEVAAGTGLRSSELRGLIWGDVVLNGPNPRVVVTRQIDHEDRGLRVAIKDRSLADHRIVPLTFELVEALVARKTEMAELRKGRAADWVFASGGQHVKQGAFDEAFNDAVAAAGIERDPNRKLTPHCLRHTFGSQQLAFGEALKPVSVWLGHRKVRTTERWYIHEIEDMQDEAGDRMRARMEERRRIRQEPVT